jgi:hypothetical protein
MISNGGSSSTPERSVMADGNSSELDNIRNAGAPTSLFSYRFCPVIVQAEDLATKITSLVHPMFTADQAYRH